MKIAVIDHVGNHGGGSRFVRKLLPALRRLEPGLRLSYFGNPDAIRRERFEEEFAAHDISVAALDSLRLTSIKAFRGAYACRAIQLIQSRWLARMQYLPDWLSGNVVAEIQRRIKGYDLAFFPWPFLLSFPQLACPTVGVFHDFNYKYYFSGSFAFSPTQRAQLERDMLTWIQNCTPVVSSAFIASELAAIYAKATDDIHVVPLAPFGSGAPASEKQAREVLARLGIHGQYILCPTHMCSHKNVGPLIAATALLQKRGHQITLVLTGAGTDAVRGHAQTFGVRLDGRNGNVLGLGYVTNFEIDCLIQCAAAVVNPSLYEAGNGPGVDAWSQGTPVAMSNIPAFLEHIDVLGVRAQVFDPYDSKDIADKIAFILSDPERARADAEYSRLAISRKTWDDTAAGYLRVFMRAVKPCASSTAGSLQIPNTV